MISEKLTKILKNIMVICMVVILAYLVLVGYSPSIIVLAVLVCIVWFILRRLLKQSKVGVNEFVKKESSTILLSLNAGEVRLGHKSIVTGNVYYPFDFMEKPVADYIINKIKSGGGK